MLMDYKQIENKAKLITQEIHNLTIIINNIEQAILYLSADQNRILVEVATNPANNCKDIVQPFYTKLT